MGGVRVVRRGVIDEVLVAAPEVDHVRFVFCKQKTAYEIIGVTGVQTCALPISEVSIQSEGLSVVVQGLVVLAGVVGDVAQAVQGVSLAIAVVVTAAQDQGGVAVGASLLVRSEERRVGQECRSRRSQYH